jgi:phage portal protein BeeE
MGLIVKAIKPTMNHDYIGAPSFRTHNPYVNLLDCYSADEYASQFPNIRSIANEYMTIRPYAIDGNGKEVKHPALDALYHPNQKDSSVLFAEKIAVSTLSLPITYILVWRNEGGEAKPGGNFGVKGRNIAGYTFLERPGIEVRDGKKYYKVGAQTFTELEVMELPGGTKPSDLYAGYSPSQAAARWSTLDSYIADFQKGFFENGAIPAGQFVITSVSKQDFEDTVEKLKESHRGAGKNNNVTYTPRPVDPNTQKPADAKIEWIPYQQSNKDIDFEPLLKHVDNRLSEAYGVSSIIKGVDSSAKYSNAEVSENGFAKRAVNPLALRNYTQITHELNRITGGLGVAITYRYQIPAISDAEKVKAETKSLEIKMITELVALGYTLDSAVDSLELSNAYKNLKLGEQAPAIIDNDKPDVDEGGEVDGAPDPDKIDGVSPLNNAKVKLELSDQEKLEAVARSYMQSQVDRVAKEYSEEAENVVQPEPETDELDAFVLAMIGVISSILLASGEEEYTSASALALLTDSERELLKGFTVKDTALDGYRSYMRRVGQSYGQDTAEAIRGVLALSDELGLTRAETEKAIKEIMNTDDWRIKRLARTELNRSQAIGSVEGMKQIQDETGVMLEKSLYHSGGAQCEYCKALEGVWVAVDQPLLSIGESIVGVDGGILVNDFANNEGYDPHPNGFGVAIYRRAE